MEISFFSVGVLGLEPRMTGPESVVLPLHHTPKSIAHQNNLVPFCGCKGTTFSETNKIFIGFFIKKRKNSAFLLQLARFTVTLQLEHLIYIWNL